MIRQAKCPDCGSTNLAEKQVCLVSWPLYGIDTSTAGAPPVFIPGAIEVGQSIDSAYTECNDCGSEVIEPELGDEIPPTGDEVLLVLADMAVFDQECNKDEYTDLDTAWLLLHQSMRRLAQYAARRTEYGEELRAAMKALSEYLAKHEGIAYSTDAPHKETKVAGELRALVSRYEAESA